MSGKGEYSQSGYCPNDVKTSNGFAVVGKSHELSYTQISRTGNQNVHKGTICGDWNGLKERITDD